MKFAHIVKHNGIEYLPGQEVPIGVEPKKEIKLADMTAKELSAYVEEKYDLVIPYQKGKDFLLETIDKAEKGELESEDDDNDPEDSNEGNPEIPEGDKGKDGEEEPQGEKPNGEEDPEKPESNQGDGEDGNEDPQDPITLEDPITGDGEQSEFVKSLLDNPETDTEA